MASWVTHLMIADRVLEEYLFLMGYYSHLITDAEFQRFIRGEQRVASVWERIKEHPILSERWSGMPEDWDSVKALISGNRKRNKRISIYSNIKRRVWGFCGQGGRAGYLDIW